MSSSLLGPRNEIGLVVLGIVYRRTDPIGQHPFRRIRLQEGFEPLGVGQIGVHPEVVSLGGQDDRHTVMNWLCELIGLGHDDGAGIDTLPLPRPVFPNACEREGLAVLDTDEVRLLGAFALSPFIVAIDRDEASSETEGVSEGRLLGDGLRAGVDGAVADLRLLGPVRDQAPMQGHELSAAPGVAGEQQSLRRSNVVLRVEVESGLGAKQIGKLLDRGESGKAAARGLRTAYTLRRSAPANPCTR